LVLAALITLSLPSLRNPVLSAAGHMLVAQDPPAKADIVIVSIDADISGSGLLEAADLVRAGFASRVGIFDRPKDKATRELMRRGAAPADVNAVTLGRLHELNVDAVLVIPTVVGTVDEGKVLQQWCAAHSIRTLIFVSEPDHSRRTRRVLDRALGQHGIKVLVRSARFSEFDPDSWWQSRGGQRTEIVEAEKLLVDLLAHPF
jgi:uncharacterized SAM-binding protein YcdF (DUF218 family)